jgi:predicted kinase
MPTLTITRGLPGSGKTTWAKEQAGAVRVNRDDLRRMLHGGRLGTDQAEKQVTIAQNAQVDALLRAGVNVIVDDTNLRQRVARDLRRIATLAGADFMVQDFTTVPLEVCVQHDAGRPVGEQVGRAVIERIHGKYLAALKGRPLPMPDEPEDQDGELVPYVPPVGAPTAIVVDVDGTVALHGDRSPYDETRVHEDRPNEPVIAVVRALHVQGHAVIFCSGRTDACSAETAKWLMKHVGVPFDALYMRHAGDMRKDSVVKRELFDQRIRDGWNVVAVLDDRDQVVRMWRSLGLTVLQVAEGNF